MTKGSWRKQDMVIYLEEYRKARLPAPAASAAADEELLCVNWNPAVRRIAAASYQTPQELSPALPEDFHSVDMGQFMSRVYALASQI